ncbi:Uncharacterised protein [Vibrio cholerae]|nr:Uncharacterised protein [Vibrio cholerae]
MLRRSDSESGCRLCSTLFTSLRMESALIAAGGSMPTIASTCSRWFWNISRTAPEPS